MRPELNIIYPGVVPYDEGLAMQLDLHERRLTGEIPDTLIILEHESVLTLGRRTDPANLLKSPEELKALGIDVVPIDRGGDVTWHGPGQITAYLIADLNHYDRSVKRYVHLLEETVITHLKNRYGITAGRDEQHPGVWCGMNKICALGVGIRNKVTYHGIALNVNADLGAFAYIVPCGITGRGVTSLKDQLGQELDMKTVMTDLAEDFITICGYEKGTISYD